MPDYPNLLIAIGASAGGLPAISRIVEQLPETYQGTIVIANHRDPKAPNVMSDIIRRRARIKVEEPEDESPIECTTIYIGAPAETVEVEDEDRDGEGNFDVDVDTSDYARIHRIDDLFKSVADVAGRNAVGVILTGMLWDGVDGLKAISAAGGKCIVQDPVEAQFKSMPENALEAVVPDFVGTTDAIAEFLVQLAEERECC